MALIYVLINKENNKMYVGKTIQSFDVRWGGHVGSARRGDNGMLICRAIKKHGSNTFDHKILEKCDESLLSEREVHWIRELKTHVSQGGYNLTFGGDGGLSGYTFSEESCEKIRRKALGRKHSEETKAKMRAAKLGKHQSPETIAKRIVANTGKTRTEEQKMKISNSLKGRVFSKETRAKLSIANSNRITSDETKQKLREASTGRHQSEDAKRRISAARSRSVSQFDLDDNLIGEHSSIKTAVFSTGVSSTSISRSLALGRPVAGFIWRYNCTSEMERK